MDTQKKNELRGGQRVENYKTEMVSHAVVYFSHDDIVKLIKQHYYYIQVKFTAARDGKSKAMNIVMNSMNTFVENAKEWVNTQELKYFDLSSDEFTVTVISPEGMKLLLSISTFDNVMTLMAQAQFAGNQSDDLRSKYFQEFKHYFMAMYKISQLTEPHFTKDGRLRDNSIDISRYLPKLNEVSTV